MKSNATTLLARMGILLLLAGVCAGGVNAFRSEGSIPWMKEWGHFVEAKAIKAGLPLADFEETRSIVDAGTHILFDARSREDFDTGRIPGSFSLPYEEIYFEFENAQLLLTPEQPILVYCSGKACDDSFQLSQFLHEQLYTNVVLYVGGFNEWKEEGAPVEGAFVESGP